LLAKDFFGRIKDAMNRLLASARWETKASGLVALASDWPSATPPRLLLNEPAVLVTLERAEAQAWATRSGCWIEGDQVHFFLWKPLCPEATDDSLRVLGPFNNWGHCTDMTPWTLHAVCLLGAEGFEVSAPVDAVFGTSAAVPFKFIRTDGRWLEPPHDADNVQRDPHGNRNLTVERARTNQHVYRFTATGAAPEQHPVRVLFEQDDLVEFCEVLASDPLDVLEPPGPFGATVSAQGTTFRVFAPRARAVSVGYSRQVSADLAVAPLPGYLELKAAGQGAWEGFVGEDLTDAIYLLDVDGRRTFDPWAKRLSFDAGVVCGPAELVDFKDGFVPPAAEDLVIVEAHVRDLLGLSAPTGIPGFRDLAQWIRRDGAYLRSLGANALELLPCTDYERGGPEEYHWGYMPISAFAPAMPYAWDDASAVNSTEAFRDLVRACHEAGLAVIMDLVLNHFGAPNALQAIDPSYYYRVDSKGELSNWSGCGNDVRAEAPMFRRLVLASLQHWTQTLGVDGVRLDLAELLGTPLLREIEDDFRAQRPEKILIAEPWSFRGHIARDLDHTTWTSWDDAFREFLPAYVRGHARAADLLHQMAACAFRPAARLRYAQSHDDMAWLDRITEQPGADALEPSASDILRTRLMHVILLCSAGIPMLSAGQDFLMSKRGVANTWRRGDLNQLDPVRLELFREEHEFVAQLIRFRLSGQGKGLRPRQAVSPGWMQVSLQQGGEAFVAVLNADGQLGPDRILVACNPHGRSVELPLPEVADWQPVVLSPRPGSRHASAEAPQIHLGSLSLPPLGCGVWVVRA
jgi:pullulanase/glycogen debranching enzyme